MSDAATILVDDRDLRRTDDGLVLVAGRCTACRAVAFPAPSSCARCTGESIEIVDLPRRGVLWSWTIQHFEPKPPYAGPSDFAPYGVGYVDLGEVIVEARLTSADPDVLAIGSPVELVEIEFIPGVVTFGFTTAATSAVSREEGRR